MISIELQLSIDFTEQSNGEILGELYENFREDVWKILTSCSFGNMFSIFLDRSGDGK